MLKISKNVKPFLALLKNIGQFPKKLYFYRLKRVR